MITLPNPLPTDAPALATLWQSALADIKTTQNADMLDSYNRAKALYPSLVTALNRACAPKPDNFDPRAGLEWMPLLREDTNNLYGNATLAEKTYLLRDQGLTFDPANAEKAFSSLVDFNARNRGLDRAAAESDIRNRFSALAALRDGIVTARTIGTELPSVGNPGAAVWVRALGRENIPSRPTPWPAPGRPTTRSFPARRRSPGRSKPAPSPMTWTFGTQRRGPASNRKVLATA